MPATATPKLPNNQALMFEPGLHMLYQELRRLNTDYLLTARQWEQLIDSFLKNPRLPNETYHTVHTRVAEVLGRTLSRTPTEIVNGLLTAVKQKHRDD